MELSAKKASYKLPPESEMTDTMSEPQQNEPQPERSSSEDFCQDFISKTSIAALPFTVETSKCLKRFWWCVLVAAMMMAIGHITYICIEFNECNKNIKVKIVSEPFEFPAVTFCNVNPMRLSKAKESPEVLKQRIENINHQNVYHYINFLQLPTNRTFNELLDKLYELMHWNYMDKDNTDNIGTVETTRRYLLYDFALLNEKNNGTFGHQLEDMLIKCSYLYGQCTRSQFQQALTFTYGNCYTWKFNNSLAQHGGRDDGLKMIFNLETDEYIPGLRDRQGVRLLIHEQNTFPSTWDEGIFLPGGSASTINLGMIKFKRIQSSCEPCGLSDDYLHKYNYTYTRNFCESLCQQKKLLKNCSCIDDRQTEINKILYNTQKRRCNVSLVDDRNCLNGVYDLSLSSCRCLNPCTETVFSKEISQVNWPLPSLHQVLFDKVCQRMSKESCNKLWETKDEKFARNFLEVEIYFGSSNYEEFEEKWETKWYSFLSEVGGSTGLWLGFTAVSLVELVFISYAALKNYKRKFFN